MSSSSIENVQSPPAVLRRNTFSSCSSFGDIESPAILRRNTFDKFTTASLSRSESVSVKPQISRTYSGHILNNKKNLKSFESMNSFNDASHHPRRNFNEEYMVSHDFDNTFGFRDEVGGSRDEEVTAITPTAIATCISHVLLKLIIKGEKEYDEGHLNGPQYDIFFGGGKNSRTMSQQKSEASFDQSFIYQLSSKSSVLSPKSSVKRQPQLDPMPTVPMITDFVAKICIETQMEYECIVIALIYVRRLIKSSDGHLVLLRDNWKGIILSCIVLSNKVWDDFHMRNLDYCYIFKGLALERVNALELQLLICLDNRCNVSPSAYAQVHFEIQAMITLTNIEKERTRKKNKKAFSSNLKKVHVTESDENLEFHTPEKLDPIKVLSSCNSYDGDDICETDMASEISPHVSGRNKEPLSTLHEEGNASPKIAEEEEISLPRRKAIRSVDLEKQKKSLRVVVHYEDESLIKPPNMAIAVKTGLSPAPQAKTFFRENSFKLAKQHSRKSFRGLPNAPPPPLAKSRRYCFPFGMCMGKIDDDI